MLTPKSASKWTADDVANLRIDFSIVTDAQEIIGDPTLIVSESSQRLIVDLEKISFEFMMEYEKSSADHRKLAFSSDSSGSDVLLSSDSSGSNVLQHPLCKALYMMDKYKNLESSVDSFVYQLLTMLGFNSEWLYIFPQFPSLLRYGDETRDSIADFTVMDVVSFLRAVVLEDKSVDVEGKPIDHSESQIIAEAIAIHQSNQVLKSKGGGGKSKKARSETSSESSEMTDVVGLRFDGFNIHFYLIPYSLPVLEAMASKREAVECTTVKKLVPVSGNHFDFRIAAHRSTVISFLDLLRQKIQKAGVSAKRRESQVWK